MSYHADLFGRLSEDGLKETFDWMADRYHSQTVRVSQSRYPSWMNQVITLVQSWRPRSIADVGCGPGYLLQQLHQRFPDTAIKGVDYSSAMLRHIPAGISTECCPLLDWAKTSSERFDVVLLTFVLRDQPDPQTVLTVIKNRVAPHGHLVVLETQTPTGWRKWGFDLYFHAWLPWWASHVLTKDWTGPRHLAPYRRLADSHRAWMQARVLPNALVAADYADIRPHRPATDVVMLWSAVAAY
ncbi:MAG: methyltransferase type 12 [Sulfobacillus acidophilus]|uniref:Methyltransferase type 12 n=1 Tax=Sulfobacillus acidophilus TaxID=53633 RepID=A0A2T2WGV7_9FIRM|nr:MAG: methyltransferase type 12 [Sulfobacillus acidophilus]